MALTEQTLKMARISGLDYADATNYMTNAIRSFKMEMTDAQRVVDVYSAIAASSATSTTELATAMSKTASSAAAVGSSFENTTAMMAVMIEATRESAENIGSAMKSIISRYGEMTSDPSKVVDSEGEEMSLNRVDKALQTVGISIHDAAGQFRDFDDVITELAGKWDTIDTNTQRYIATIMAGNRQQSRFLALVSNGERLAELSEEAANSEDTATLQFLKTLDSIDAKTQQLKTSLQSLYIDTGIENLFKTMLDYGNKVVQNLTRMGKLFKLPIPAIVSIGVTFWNVSRVVSAVFDFLKTKIISIRQEINARLLADTQSAAQQRILISRDEMNKILQTWNEEEKAYEVHQEQLNRATISGEKTRAGLRNGSMVGGTPNAGEQKQPGWLATHSRGVSLAASMASVGLSALSAGTNNKGVKIGASIGSSTMSGLAMGSVLGHPIIGALLGGLIGFFKNFSSIFPTLEQQIENFKQEAEEKNNTALQKRADTKDLAAQIKSLEKLKAARYDSVEAEEEYIEASNQMADKYPNLIESLDEAGNATINLQAAEIELARSRQQAIEAAQQAAAANYKVAKTEQEKAGEDVGSGAAEYFQFLGGRFDFERTHKSDTKLSSFQNALSDAFGLSFNSDKEVLDEAQELYDTILDPEELQQSIFDLLSDRLPEYTNLDEKLGELFSSFYSGYSSISDIVDSNLYQLIEDISNPDSILYNDGNFEKNVQEELNKIAPDDLTPDDQIMYNLIKDTLMQGMGSSVQGFLQSSTFVDQTLTSEIAKIVGAKISGLNDEYLTGIENSTEIINLAIRDKIKDKNPEEYLNSPDIIKDITESQEMLANYYKQLTSFDVSKLNNLVKNKGIYSSEQYEDYLKNTLYMTDELVALYMQDYQDKLYTTDDLISAIGARNRKDLPLLDDDFSSQFNRLNFFDSLGGDERKKILEVYDQIGSQIDASNISADTGRDALDKYIGVWEATQNLGDQAEAAQSIIKNWDDFSFAGLQELHQTLIEQFGEGNQDVEELYKAAAEFANLMPKNFETEIQTYSQKISSGMSNFEKAISNASKGMDFSEATELANKIGVKITDFEFKDGKYFADNYFDQIQEAYFGANSEWVTNLEAEKDATIDAFSRGSRKEGRESSIVSNFERAALESEDALTNWIEHNADWIAGTGFSTQEFQAYGSAYLDYKNKLGESAKEFREWLPEYISGLTNSTIDEAKKYIADQEARSLISNGKISEAIKKIKPYDVKAQQLINSERWDDLIERYPQFAKEISSNYLNIAKNTYDSIISGFDSTQYIEVTDFNKNILESLSTAGLIEKITNTSGDIVYKTLKDVDLDDLAARVAADMDPSSERDKILSQIHSEKYAEKTYNVLSDIVGSYDKLSYEVAQKYANAQNKTVEALIAEGTFSVDAAGNISMAEEALLDELNKARMEAITTGDQKLYNDLYAQYQKHKNETADNQILATVIQNRDKLSEENIASLATMLGQTYELVARVLHKNSDGTYSVTLNMLSAMISVGQKEISQEIVDLFATEIDEILSSITGLAGSQSKGFTDLGSMQKYVSEMRKRGVTINGEEASLQNMFEYNDSLNAYQLSEQGIIAHIKGMKSELDKLQYSLDFAQKNGTKSPEELREIQEQMEVAETFINDTIRQFAENINISDYLNTQFGDPAREIKKEELVNAIEDYNAALFAIGEKEGLNADKIITALNKGGEAAVAAMETVAKAQGRTLSADEVASAYRSQIERYINSLETITAKPGEIVDATTASIIQLNGGAVNELGDTGQYIVQTAANLYEAYKGLLNRMRATGEATLAELNQVAALALENKDGQQATIDALGDAAGMTYTRFGEILTNAGYQLTEGLVNDLEQSGIIRGLGGNKMQIVDFSAFADLVGLESGSDEYVSAFKSYNDSLIDMNRKAERNILEEAKSVADAKGGDWVNLTQLTSKLNETALSGLNQKLYDLGAFIEDGILKIADNADIYGIAMTIQDTAAKSGGLLSDELNELADAINEVLKNYTELITNGIQGSLTEQQKGQLQDFANIYGLGELDFHETEEGLKLSEESATRLYYQIAAIDTLQGHIVFNELKDSLQESNEDLANISTTSAAIARIQKQIAENLSKDSDDSDREQIEKENEALEQQLKLYQEIAVAQSSDAESFDFMGRDLPESMNGPINYWNSTGSAYKAMNQAASSGYMEIQDFYNIINEMTSLAEMSGQQIEFMGYSIDGSLENSAALIEQGFSALSNVDGEGVKIDLSKLAANLQTGANTMGEGFDDAIKTMAKSQIAMLDSMINVLETVVAMEKLGDIAGEDHQFDWGELFSFTDGEISYDEDQGQKFVDQLREMADNNETLKAALESFFIEGFSLYDLLSADSETLEKLGSTGRQQLLDAINALLSLSEVDYDPNNIQQSVSQALSNVGLTSSMRSYSYNEAANLSYVITPELNATVDWSQWGEEQFKEIEGLNTQEQAQALLKKYVEGKVTESEELKQVLQLTRQITVESSEGEDGQTTKVYTWNGQQYNEDQLDQLINNINKHDGVDLSTVKYDESAGTYTFKTKLNYGIECEVTQNENGDKSTYKFADGSEYTADSEEEAFQQWYEKNREWKGASGGFETEEEVVARVNQNMKLEAGEPVIENQEQFTNRTQEKVNDLMNALIGGKTKDIETQLTDLGVNIKIGEGGITVEQVEQIQELFGISSEDKILNLAINVTNDDGQLDWVKQLIDGPAEIPPLTLTIDTQGEEGLTANGDISDLTVTKIDKSHYDQTLKLSDEIAEGEANISNVTVNATNFTPSEQLAALQSMDFSSTSMGLSGIAGAMSNISGASFGNFDALSTVLETIEGQVDSIWKTIQNFANQTFTVNMNTTTTTTPTSDSGGQFSGFGKQFKKNVAPQTQTLDPTNFNSGIQSVQSALDGLTAEPAQNAANAFISAMKSTMGSVPSSKSVTIKVNTPKDTTLAVKAGVDVIVTVKGSGPISKGTVNISGDTTASPKSISSTITASASAKGTAAARGRKTLVGELGPELVVSNGRYYTVGNDGAEFVNLPEDAIVFNHLQTKKLLNNKKVNGRGDVATTEKRAVAWATGNTTGPAMASASAALAALKQIRAMWQSMLDASARDLGSQAGRGGAGGGGGGGGGGGDEKDLTTTTAEIERWYNLLRQIDKIQKDISYQEKLQEKYESDRIANGQKIFETQKEQYKLLEQELTRHQQVAELQKSWYDNARKELAESWYGKYIFTYTEDGLQQYISDAKGSGRGLDILEELTKRDKATGEAIGNGATAEAQLRYLAGLGLDLSDLLYNEDGSKIADDVSQKLEITNPHDDRKDETPSEKNDIYVEMMENFWNQLDGWKDELDGLYDSYREQLDNVIENQNAQYEILQAWVDNELDVEQELLDAIESREQQAIDALQDQRDALEDSTSKFLDGLNKSLSKEREMYNKNQSDTELTKLQRQLAILQRSGGSASQIRDLQQQIASKQQDAYFEAQQKQIDAIQEASDLEIERLDAQIDIMTETLEYQKEYGLLWGEVREIMATNSAEEAAEKVRTWNEEYFEKSSLDIQESIREFQEKFEQWTGYKTYQELQKENHDRVYSTVGTKENKENQTALKQLEDEERTNPNAAGIKSIAINEAKAAALQQYNVAKTEDKSEEEAMALAEQAYTKSLQNSAYNTEGAKNQRAKEAAKTAAAENAYKQWAGNKNRKSVLNNNFSSAQLKEIEKSFKQGYLNNVTTDENNKVTPTLDAIAKDQAIEAVSDWVSKNEANFGIPYKVKSNQFQNGTLAINNNNIKQHAGKLSVGEEVLFICSFTPGGSNSGPVLEFVDKQGKHGYVYADELNNDPSNNYGGSNSIYSRLQDPEYFEKIKKQLLQYSTGGLNDFTGPAMLHGTKQHPEAVLNAAQTDFLRNDLLSNKNNSLISIVSQLQDLMDDTANSSISTINDEGVVFKDITINISSDTISNDYDAHRAGEQILDEMLRIARKSGTRGISRR